jgi:nucleoside-diphosphate-sugar epimerase
MGYGGGMSGKLFVFGLGYSASAVAAELVSRGWQVAGTVRSRSRMDELAEKGFTPLLFSDDRAVQAGIASATHLLISAPPSETGDPALEAYAHLIRIAPMLQWIGYLSTIAVYGDRQGAWVDEDAATAPASSRGVARIKAEHDWESLSREAGLPLDIFRLSGIYGPGRSPLDKVREGKAQRIVKQGQVFNRIHVHDIASSVLAAMLQERQQAEMRTFNVTDDEPAPPQDVVLLASQLLGVPPPPEVAFEEAALSPMARSFYEDNKRVRNDKIKRELGVTLRYPTYRDGLAALAGTLPNAQV